MATVYIPAQWRDVTGPVDQVEVSGDTLRQVLAELEARYPGVLTLVCEGDRIAPHLAVSIDGAITSRGMRSLVGPASEVHFLPAIGGG